MVVVVVATVVDEEDVVLLVVVDGQTHVPRHQSYPLPPTNVGKPLLQVGGRVELVPGGHGKSPEVRKDVPSGL